MRGRALLLGVSKYPRFASGGARDLPSSDVDLIAMRASLASAVAGFASPANVEVLANPRAADAMREVHLFSDAGRPGDVHVVYFTGHAVLTGSGASFCFPDATDDDVVTDRVAFDDLFSEVNQSLASHVVIVLDCCHSGAMALAIEGSKAKPHRFLLAACHRSVAAHATTKFGSLYTTFLVSELQSPGAGTGKDGALTPIDLHRRVHDRMSGEAGLPAPVFAQSNRSTRLPDVSLAPLRLTGVTATRIAPTDLPPLPDPSALVENPPRAVEVVSAVDRVWSSWPLRLVGRLGFAREDLPTEAISPPLRFDFYRWHVRDWGWLPDVESRSELTLNQLREAIRAGRVYNDRLNLDVLVTPTAAERATAAGGGSVTQDWFDTARLRFDDCTSCEGTGRVERGCVSCGGRGWTIKRDIVPCDECTGTGSRPQPHEPSSSDPFVLLFRPPSIEPAAAEIPLRPCDACQGRGRQERIRRAPCEECGRTGNIACVRCTCEGRLASVPRTRVRLENIGQMSDAVVNRGVVRAELDGRPIVHVGDISRTLSRTTVQTHEGPAAIRLLDRLSNDWRAKAGSSRVADRQVHLELLALWLCVYQTAGGLPKRSLLAGDPLVAYLVDDAARATRLRATVFIWIASFALVLAGALWFTFVR